MSETRDEGVVGMARDGEDWRLLLTGPEQWALAAGVTTAEDLAWFSARATPGLVRLGDPIPGADQKFLIALFNAWRRGQLIHVDAIDHDAAEKKLAEISR